LSEAQPEHPEVSPLVATLLSPPSPAQRRLLDIVARVQLNAPYEGPTFYYLEEELDRVGSDAREVLAGFPVIHIGEGPRPVRYGPVWFTPELVPPRESLVRLTVLGLSLSSNGGSLAGMTMALIRVLSILRTRVGGFSPDRSEDPEVSREAVWQMSFPPHTEGWEEGMLRREPPTWGAVFRPQAESGWTVSLPRSLRGFDDVNTITDYLERLVRRFAEPAGAPQRTVASPFSLPAAIDYFDAIWRLAFSEPIIVVPGAERAAKLAFGASTLDEFDSRLSALAELMKVMHVPSTPGLGGGALQRLPYFLKARLPPEGHESVDAAIARLDAARRVRLGGQHSAGPDVIDALRSLGVPYPIIDPGGAWAQISLVVAASFDTLREEIQASGLSAPPAPA